MGNLSVALLHNKKLANNLRNQRGSHYFLTLNVDSNIQSLRGLPATPNSDTYRLVTSEQLADNRRFLPFNVSGLWQYSKVVACFFT